MNADPLNLRGCPSRRSPQLSRGDSLPITATECILSLTDVRPPNGENSGAQPQGATLPNWLGWTLAAAIKLSPAAVVSAEPAGSIGSTS
jgi:hypothetical protein